MPQSTQCACQEANQLKLRTKEVRRNSNCQESLLTAATRTACNADLINAPSWTKSTTAGPSPYLANLPARARFSNGVASDNGGKTSGGTDNAIAACPLAAWGGGLRTARVQPSDFAARLISLGPQIGTITERQPALPRVKHVRNGPVVGKQSPLINVCCGKPRRTS